MAASPSSSPTMARMKSGRLRQIFQLQTAFGEAHAEPFAGPKSQQRVPELIAVRLLEQFRILETGQAGKPLGRETADQFVENGRPQKEDRQNIPQTDPRHIQNGEEKRRQEHRGAQVLPRHDQCDDGTDADRAWDQDLFERRIFDIAGVF